MEDEVPLARAGRFSNSRGTDSSSDICFGKELVDDGKAPVGNLGGAPPAVTGPLIFRTSPSCPGRAAGLADRLPKKLPKLFHLPGRSRISGTDSDLAEGRSKASAACIRPGIGGLRLGSNDHSWLGLPSATPIAVSRDWGR